MAKIYLKEWAKKKDIVLSNMAEETGISQPNISMISTGKVWPSSLTVDKLSKALGIKPHQLMQDPEQVPDDNQVIRKCPHCGKDIEITITPL